MHFVIYVIQRSAIFHPYGSGQIVFSTRWYAWVLKERKTANWELYLWYLHISLFVPHFIWRSLLWRLFHPDSVEIRPKTDFSGI